MARNGRITINGFWHICMINHYKDIVNDQLKIIIDSGLYKRLNRLYVCCVGDMDSYKDLRKFFKPYNKVEIHNFTKNIIEYEFITLNSVYQHSVHDHRFYGFYIHTKGVNYPGNEGGKYWIDYMNYYNLDQWRSAVTELDKGYETYGVKLIDEFRPPANQMHYSGNFFWFDSTYVCYIDNVYDLNTNNRGEAEMWICSGSPIAATACQKWVDYDTKGKFKPFKIKSNL